MMGREKPQPAQVSVLALAWHRLGVDPGTPLNASDFVAARLCEIGGCELCGESISARTAFPAITGFLRCSECVAAEGWFNLNQANADIFGEIEDG
jgi:hypothetical protein